jgi:hypothetical protein
MNRLQKLLYRLAFNFISRRFGGQTVLIPRENESTTKENTMPEKKLFTGKVTKSYIFNVEVEATSKEEATSYVMDLLESDFDESCPQDTVTFIDGTVLEITTNSKEVMDYGLLAEAADKENL